MSRPCKHPSRVVRSNYVKKLPCKKYTYAGYVFSGEPVRVWLRNRQALLLFTLSPLLRAKQRMAYQCEVGKRTKATGNRR